MPRRTLKFHRLARWIMEQLSEAEQQQVNQAAGRLLEAPPSRWPKELVTRLRDDEPLYLLHVSPELRAFVKLPSSKEIEITNVMYAERLRNLARGGNNGVVSHEEVR